MSLDQMQNILFAFLTQNYCGSLEDTIVANMMQNPQVMAALQVKIILCL